MVDSSDYFDLNYKISTLFMLIPPKMLIPKLIYRVAAIPHFFLICGSAFLEFGKLLVGGSGEFSANILNLGISGLHLMAVNRVTSWLFSKGEFDVILERIRKINIDFSLFEYQHEPAVVKHPIVEYKMKKMQETKQHCLRITLSFLAYVFLNIAVSYVFNYMSPTYEKWNPAVNKTSVYRDYPYPLWYPFDTSLSDGYYLLGFIYQPYAFFFLMCSFFCIDYLCVSTIIHLTSHVNILGYAFNYVDKNIDPMLDFREVVELKHERIIKLIKELKEIYKCAKMLNQVFSGQLLIQELLMSLVICCSVYRVTSVTSSTEMTYLSTMSAVAGLEMFTVSWFNQNFTFEVFDLQYRIYELEWLDYPPKLRRLLLFLTCRVQKPFHFTMGFGFPLDLSVFLTMIKMSYSFYTLITQSSRTLPIHDISTQHLQ